MGVVVRVVMEVRDGDVVEDSNSSIGSEVVITRSVVTSGWVEDVVNIEEDSVPGKLGGVPAGVPVAMLNNGSLTALAQ